MNTFGFLLALTTAQKYLIGGGALVVLVVLALVAVFLIGKKRGKRVRESQKDKTYIEDGVRLSYDGSTTKENGDVRVSQVKDDTILLVGKNYCASKNGYLMPGKYVVLSASENENTFNIRQGLFVREYRHGDAIVIAGGEEITAVSCTLILR